MGENPRPLEHEDGIVWTEDVEAFDYVLQSVELSVSTRRNPVPWRGNRRRVGSAMLRPDASNGVVPGQFLRRVFWVKEHDRSEQPNGMYKSALHRAKRLTHALSLRVSGANSPSARGEHRSLGRRPWRHPRWLWTRRGRLRVTSMQ
ncbi:DUF6009 family protein [Streptomyces capoamus]|uniref:DUF6009 family protein n=1 Tax=Streptomyces capoamus TaxID=68183 RepID=UPI003C2C5EF6